MSTASTATLQNKTLATSPFCGVSYANTQNTVAHGSQTNYISTYEKTIYLRAQNAAGDKNHYLIYMVTLLDKKVALVDFDGGILSASNGNTWALKWNSCSNINLNRHIERRRNSLDYS